MSTRAGAVSARTAAIYRLKGLIVSAPDEPRAERGDHTSDSQIDYCAKLRDRPAHAARVSTSAGEGRSRPAAVGEQQTAPAKGGSCREGERVQADPSLGRESKHSSAERGRSIIRPVRCVPARTARSRTACGPRRDIATPTRIFRRDTLARNRHDSIRCGRGVRHLANHGAHIIRALVVGEEFEHFAVTVPARRGPRGRDSEIRH